MSRTSCTQGYNPFDCRVLAGCLHMGQWRTMSHIRLGIHKNSRHRKYGAGVGSDVELGDGGGNHQFFNLDVRFPLLLNISLPTQHWSCFGTIAWAGEGSSHLWNVGCWLTWLTTSTIKSFQNGR